MRKWVQRLRSAIRPARPFRQFLPVAWSVRRTHAVLQAPVDPVDVVHRRIARGGFQVIAVAGGVLAEARLGSAELVAFLQKRRAVGGEQEAEKQLFALAPEIFVAATVPAVLRAVAVVEDRAVAQRIAVMDCEEVDGPPGLAGRRGARIRNGPAPLDELLENAGVAEVALRKKARVVPVLADPLRPSIVAEIPPRAVHEVPPLASVIPGLGMQVRGGEARIVVDPVRGVRRAVREHPCEVEPEPVDPIIAVPRSKRVQDHSLGEPVAAGKVDVVARSAVIGETGIRSFAVDFGDIVAKIVTLESEASVLQPSAAFAGVIVDNVHEDCDAAVVERLHELLQLDDFLSRF